MPGRRARTGRGWDAAPPRPPRTRKPGRADAGGWAPAGPDESLWAPDEEGYVPGVPRGDQPDEPLDSAEPVDASGHEGTPGRRSTGRGRPGSADDRRDTPRGGRPAGGGRGGRWPAKEPVDDGRDPAEVAREICLNQLAVRPRTRAELATALARRGIAPEVAAEVLDRYDEVGIIDDAAFARAWVSSRHHGRGLASRALAGELRTKGVDKELADAALAELDGDTEAATARDLVDRKLRSAGNTAPDALFRRLVGMLARKGYPPGLAIRVVKEAISARTEESGILDDLDPDAADHLMGTDLVDDTDGSQPFG